MALRRLCLSCPGSGVEETGNRPDSKRTYLQCRCDLQLHLQSQAEQELSDKAIAKGVTINTGAMIALSSQTKGQLTTGLTLTLISNTSANLINGTFSNLPDGGIVMIKGNKFQASYSGGDGNDLTITVVP